MPHPRPSTLRFETASRLVRPGSVSPFATAEYQDMTEPMTLTPGQEASGGRAVDRVDRLLHAVERTTAIASGLFIFGLMLVGVVQIVGRTVFNAPIFGYIDAIEMSIAVFAFLAIAYCERMNGHVRMELFVGKLRGRAAVDRRGSGSGRGLVRDRRIDLVRLGSCDARLRVR